MDKELQEAQKLTRDDLLAKLEQGQPAKLSRRAPRDANQRAKAVVDAATTGRRPARGLLIDGQYHEVIVLTREPPALIRFPASTHAAASESAG